MKESFMYKYLPSGIFSALLCLVLPLVILTNGCVAVPSMDIFSNNASGGTVSLNSARSAWDSKDMVRVESLYLQLLNSGTLDLATQEEAWRRIVVAANTNEHPKVVLNALDNWLILNKEADKTKTWQNAWVRNVRFLASSEVVKRAEQIYLNTASDGAYVRAVIIMVGRAWTAKQSEQFISLLSRYYQSQDQEQRIALERILSNELRYSPFSNLQELADISPKDLIFPYTVILLEKTRREVNQGKNKDAEIEMLNFYLADKTLIKHVMTSTGGAAAISPESPVDKNKLTIQAVGEEICIVLALPSQGPLGSIATKIKVGASAAQQELTAGGSKVSIKYISTDTEGWLNQLNELPAYCAIVGGPLQLAKYKDIKNTTIAASRNIFAFTPQMEGRDEGSLMWRFFPSPTDQVNSLITFTKDNLGISWYGAFYPDDAYGLRMSNLFEQAVSVSGGSVKKESYAQSDASTWVGQSKQLLDAHIVNDTSISRANFQAVFLPDSWKNMEMISTSLLFHGEDRQILLGTALWEQGLSFGAGHALAKYKLAIFPGVWNPTIIPPSLQNTYDLVFWNILGYDFIRFAYALNLKQYNKPQELQSKLQNAENISWTMAPMRWDAQGRASQEMIIFTPTETGFAPVNVEEFKALWTNSLKRYDSRVSSILKGD